MSEGSPTPEAVAPNTPHAIDFLRRFEPDGPWVLTAIVPDGGKTYTDTFGPGTEEECEAWIDSHQGIRNVYFMVNPPTRALQSKAKKSDVREMRWLHVDSDPEAGKDLAAERERILKKLQEFRPEPTVILDSGGGYQAFWKLSEPVPVNGSEQKCEELEAFNQQLELLLGGDHCHNLDRIMRLPGTINVPGEKKRKKGRVPALATAIKFDDKIVYSLSQFTAAPRVQVGGEEGFTGGGARVRISGNLPRIDDPADLPVSDKTRMLIVQGGDPDDPTKWGSRSELLFHVVCEMVRAGCDDDTMAAVIMDRDFGISASVLDKPRPQEYAARQIERAREEAIDPWLRKLNEQHMVIGNDGGKCQVAEWKSHEGREQLVFQTFTDFQNRYVNKFIAIQTDNGSRNLPVGKWWLRHPMRREFPGLTFQPGGPPIVGGDLNLWRGYGVKPMAGDWSLMRAHIQEVLASGNQVHADYIMRWLAYVVQNPDKPAEVALVLRGGQGTGKGVLGRAMCTVFGQHGLQVSSAMQFAGRFNAHLRDVCLLFADEAVRPEDPNARSALKALLTEPRLAIEGKGRDIVAVSNHTKVIMASNDRWVVPAELDDRRFAVFDVSSAHAQDRHYFSALLAEMDRGGLAAMLHDLLVMPLEGWHPRDEIPNTDARSEQKAASLRGIEAVFLDLLQAGEIPGELRGQGRVFVATVDLQQYMSNRLRGENITLNRVSNLLATLGSEKDRSRRPSGYVLPTLPEARAAWNQTMFRFPWDDSGEWSVMYEQRDRD
jgi:hypothetical protein